MEFKIKKTWDSRPIDHDVTKIYFRDGRDVVIMDVFAHFFEDPLPPSGAAGQPFENLSDYEVVAAFFRGEEDKYLEVEVSPHGQYLISLLSGRRNVIKMGLPMTYEVQFICNRWHGTARIPKAYFPLRTYHFNVYALHGSGEGRHYEALFPVPRNRFKQPDLHRIRAFGKLYFSIIFQVNPALTLSDVWREAVENHEKGLSCKASDTK